MLNFLRKMGRNMDVVLQVAIAAIWLAGFAIIMISIAQDAKIRADKEKLAIAQKHEAFFDK